MAEKKLPRGLRNNNPGNIRINSDLFQGEVRPSKDKSFKQFETMAYGYRAIFKILSNYYNNYKLDTIRKMILKAPVPVYAHVSMMGASGGEPYRKVYPVCIRLRRYPG